MIYFLLAPKAQAVKIGFSVDVCNRIKTLQTGNHEPLELLGTIEGTMQLERMIHDELKRFRLTGEWFDFRRSVRLFIETCVSTGDWIKAKTVWLLPSVNEETQAFGKSLRRVAGEISDERDTQRLSKYLAEASAKRLSLREIERGLRISIGLSQSRAKRLISALKADGVLYENKCSQKVQIHPRQHQNAHA